MATTQIKELSDKNPDGTRLGQSATDLVGFHGATPSVQSSVKATVTVSTTITVLVDAVNAILDCLKTKGLMASS